MAKSKLIPLHVAFADAWLANGFNGVQAYFQIKPKVTYNTAARQSSDILKRDDVQTYIAKSQTKNKANKVAERDFLILQAHDLGLKAEDNDKLDTALKAVDSKAKLAGLYTQEVDQGEGYADLLKTLVIVNGNVNVNTQQQKGNDPVDITPSDYNNLQGEAPSHADLLG